MWGVESGAYKGQYAVGSEQEAVSILHYLYTIYPIE